MRYVGIIGKDVDVYEENGTWIIGDERFKVREVGQVKIKITDESYFNYEKTYKATKYDSDANVYYVVEEDAETWVYKSEEVEEV